MKIKKSRFLRSESVRNIRLGKNKPKLHRWRRPRGKHNKIRLKRFGYPVQPGIGFRKPKAISGKILGLRPVLIHNSNELKDLTKNDIAILARTGAKKKLSLIKEATEKGIRIANLGSKTK